MSKKNKIGSYSVSSINSDFKNKVVKKPLKKSKKKIIHQIFLDASEISDDIFWIEKLKLASRNKFPPGFYYLNDNINYGKGKKLKFISIIDKPLEEVYNDFKLFLQNNASIFSPNDIEYFKKIETQNSIDNIEEELTWKNTNKRMHESLVSIFITEIRKKYSLNEIESEKMETVVKMGISDKYFGNDNIIVRNKKIVEIKGLQWNENLREFRKMEGLQPMKNRNLKKSKKEDEDFIYKNSIPNFTNKWKKYSEHINKRICRNMKINRLANIIDDNDDENHDESSDVFTFSMEKT